MIGVKTKRVLGVAVSERAIHVAELSSTREGARLVRCASFELPKGATWENTNAIGPAFKTFLQESKFEAKTAVVGLSGRWVLVKQMAVPPATAQAAAGILRLAAEREYHADAREWALDYLGEPSSSEKSTVLLAATPRQRMARVLETLAAAELRVSCVTMTTLALANTKPASDAPGGAVLSLASDGVELAVRAGGRVVAVERVPTTSGPTMDTEIRRVLASTGHNPDAGKSMITAWDQTGLSRADVNRLGERVGMAVRINPDSHELGILNGTPGSNGFTPATAGAVALAMLGVSEARSIDFLSTRMTPAPPSRWTTPRKLAAIAAALVALLLLFVVADWYSASSEVSDLQAQKNALRESHAIAETNVSKFDLVRGWYDNRPHTLDCLRAVTLAFPTNGQVWASSITVREDMSVVLACKAQSEGDVTDLLNRFEGLRKAGTVRDVKLVMKQMDRNSRVVTFAVTFSFNVKG